MELAPKLVRIWESLGIELDVPSEFLEGIKISNAPLPDLAPARKMLLVSTIIKT